MLKILSMFYSGGGEGFGAALVNAVALTGVIVWLAVAWIRRRG
jgi:hypothetical protein